MTAWARWRKTGKWKRRRVREILARDGPQCWLCDRALQEGAKRAGRRTTIEHLQPRCAGGGDALDNLVLCHHACNLHLRNHPPEKKRQIRAKWHKEAARMRERAPPAAGA